MEALYPNVRKRRWIARILEDTGNLILDDGSEWRIRSSRVGVPGTWRHNTVVVVTRPSEAGGLYTLRGDDERIVVAHFCGFRPIFDGDDPSAKAAPVRVGKPPRWRARRDATSRPTDPKSDRTAS